MAHGLQRRDLYRVRRRGPRPAWHRCARTRVPVRVLRHSGGHLSDRPWIPLASAGRNRPASHAECVLGIALSLYVFRGRPDAMASGRWLFCGGHGVRIDDVEDGVTTKVVVGHFTDPAGNLVGVAGPK